MTSKFSLLPAMLRRSELLGAVSVTSDGTARRPGVTYTLGDPGRPAKEPTLLIAVFDNSGSVTGPAGNDPLSNRFAEVAHAFSVVARRGANHELGAVLHFDTPTSGDVGPTPITKRGLVMLRRGLHMPPDGAGTSELMPSLRRAVELAEAHPDHHATLVVLSDFQLFDSDQTQVFADLAAFPGQVHAVVLGGRNAAEFADSTVTVTKISREMVPGAVARVLFASLISHRPGSRVADA